MQDGLLEAGPGRALSSIADFYDMKNLDISGEAGNVVIETKYGDGYELKEIHNNGSSVVTIILMTARTPATEITLKLAAYSRSGRLPKIHTIKQSGTGDDLLLFLQFRK